jgi:hypothetical protein
VENEQGLLIDFTIIGTEVNGSPATTSLLAEFGDIGPTLSGTARWNMISTLSGEFVEFDVSFTHADELGGELTSLIEDTIPHYLIRDVLVDLPGRDNIRDFLGNVDNVPGSPLMLYESDSLESAVTDLSLSAGEVNRVTS